jgi:hypothetical protein
VLKKLTCVEQQMTLHYLHSVQGWNKKECSFGCSFCHVWSSLMTK